MVRCERRRGVVSGSRPTSSRTRERAQRSRSRCRFCGAPPVALRSAGAHAASRRNGCDSVLRGEPSSALEARSFDAKRECRMRELESAGFAVNPAQPGCAASVVAVEDRDDRPTEDAGAGEGRKASGSGEAEGASRRVRVPQRLGWQEKRHRPKAVRSIRGCLALSSRAACGAASGARDVEGARGTALVEKGARIRGGSRSPRGGMRTRRLPDRALQRAGQSHALDRRRRGSLEPGARPARPRGARGARAQPAVEALRQRLRRSVPRSRPALAAGGGTRCATCCATRTSTAGWARRRSTIRARQQLRSMDGTSRGKRLS